MWAPCLEDELTSCVVLVFVLHDVLWDQGPNWRKQYYRRMMRFYFLKHGGFAK
jgi:hypothetical protein